MKKYLSGQIPKIGDLVEISPNSPRVKAGFKKLGLRGIVSCLGDTFKDPMPFLVLVDWEDEKNSDYKTSDIMLSELNLITRP